MRRFLASVLLLVSLAVPALAQDESIVVPDQRITGAEKPIVLGELAELSLTPIKIPPHNFLRARYTWTLIDSSLEEKPVRALGVMGDSVVFGTGIVPRQARIVVGATYVYSTKDGTEERVASITSLIQFGGPAPAPTPVVPHPPVPAPEPVPPAVAPPPATAPGAQVMLHATVIFDRSKPTAADGLFLASAANLKADLAALNCKYRDIDLSSDLVKKQNLGGVVAQAGGPPVLIIQAEGTAIPLSVLRGPANAAAVIAEVQRVRGLP